MSCQSLRDARFSVLEWFSKMYHSKTIHWHFIMQRRRWYPPEEDKHGGRSLFWLCRNFSSLLNCSYFHFSLHTGCSDLKNARWVDVFMCVIYVSQQSPLCHGLWKNDEIQTASFSKQSGLPSWKHASRYFSKCFLPDEDKTAKFGECSGMYANKQLWSCKLIQLSFKTKNNGMEQNGLNDQ